MPEGVLITSHMFAALAGIFFIKGLVILSGGRRKREWRTSKR